MSDKINIPEFLTEDFSMYLENMESLKDPENPDLLKNYLADLYKQLAQSPMLFTSMADQLAMAISTKIRLNTKNLALLNFDQEPEWGDVKACIGVHNDARACITEIMTSAEQVLKTAVLLIYFYNNYDPTPLKVLEEDDHDDYAADDFDENY